MMINQKQFSGLLAIASMLGENCPTSQSDISQSPPMIGKNVIIRTYSAGCWFGIIEQKDGTEVILNNARRMYRWQTAKGVSLSAVALYGIDQSRSKIIEPVSCVWLNAIEIIHCTDIAITLLEGAPHVKSI